MLDDQLPPELPDTTEVPQTREPTVRPAVEPGDMPPPGREREVDKGGDPDVLMSKRESALQEA